jgi:hypothetical protein
MFALLIFDLIFKNADDCFLGLQNLVRYLSVSHSTSANSANSPARSDATPNLSHFRLLRTRTNSPTFSRSFRLSLTKQHSILEVALNILICQRRRNQFFLMQTVSNTALLVCSAYVCYAFGTCLVHVYGWIHA